MKSGAFAAARPIMSLRVRYENHGCAFRLRRFPPMASKIMARETSIRFS